MIFFHADRSLTAYLHGELTERDRERVERHLARCARCRTAAERLQAAHAAFPKLPVCAAPDRLWQRIEQQLDAAQTTTPDKTPISAAHNSKPSTQQASSQQPETALPSNTEARHSRNGHNRIPFVFFVSFVDKNQPRAPRIKPWLAAAIVCAAIAAVVLVGTRMALRQQAASWEVRTLQGRPVIGWFAFGERGKLHVGDSLVTDKRSRAEITVADIGTVTIAPGSRVQLAQTSSAQHRLKLEQGALEARVNAPPRLFVVDTQAGRAVDLGCAYRLETDGGNSTLLKVTLGEVALEDGGRSSLVPRGFSCESRRVGGLGTPIHDHASEAFRNAVRRFDFEAGGDLAADEARVAAHKPDAITLWHMLWRSSPTERGKLFDTMAALSRPPKSGTRAGVVGGDAKMLEDWKEAILYDLAESEIAE